MNKKKVAIITSVIALLILVVGVSYAFYSANVKEENKTQTVIKTNELTIVYTGTEEINVEGIVPGDSFTKKFTVENTSNIPVTYNIYLEGITNEFNEDLVYTLKDKDGEIIAEEVLSSTNTGKTYLITDIEIDSTEIKEYEMTIEFKYSDKDQNKLQGKVFNATLGIDTKPVKIVKVVNEKLELDKLSSGDTVTKEFSVKNLSKETQSYDLKLSDVVSTYGDNLTYSLTKNGTEVVSNETMPTSDATILTSQVLAATSIDEYIMTINFDGTTAALEYMLAAENDSFSGKLTTATKEVLVYKEEILNGADPAMNDSLIPVIIEDDGTVKKANIKNEWYSYENKKWANAVILEDNKKEYDDNEIIPESNIESYFVWIPKFSYKIFDLGLNSGLVDSKPTTNINKPINIKFGLTNTNDNTENECTTPMTSGEKGNCNVNDYMTHPAFISMSSNGFWIAKFETTGTITDLSSKPNKTSLRNNNVKASFEAAYSYKREIDSHMLKNTEWAAVAYLSHSKYGINTEVRINNNSNYLTGYASTDTADQTSFPGTSGTASNITQPYNSITGYKASTTGNITGVYDMSGGAHEYVAAYVQEKYGESGFNSSTISKYDSKYFDIYNSNSDENSYNMRILGDATGEMGQIYNYADKDKTYRYHNSWYADLSYFPNSTSSWFSRGGYYSYGILSGQFYFAGYTGNVYSNSMTFRLALI